MQAGIGRVIYSARQISSGGLFIYMNTNQFYQLLSIMQFELQESFKQDLYNAWKDLYPEVYKITIQISYLPKFQYPYGMYIYQWNKKGQRLGVDDEYKYHEILDPVFKKYVGLGLDEHLFQYSKYHAWIEITMDDLVSQCIIKAI
jgi:hypothetical protein